jgi:hypothetical protein
MSGKCPYCGVTYIVLIKHKCALKNVPTVESAQEKINRLTQENEYLKSYTEFLVTENKILKECLLGNKPVDKGEFLLN